MNKLLPTFKRPALSERSESKGFTLIELLVVIAIIAILATIAATIFSGVQARARDGRRQADTIAIAKAMEANKGSTTNVYKSLSTAMFAGGVVPTDPSVTQSYCIGWNTTSGTAVPKPTAWGATVCPVAAGWAGATEIDVAGDGQPCAGAAACSPSGADTTIVNFQVCAKSEVTATNFLCTPNQQ